ncbi:MAG: tRNA threonylcarbamoyladenosine biosynthesis protein TsaB [Bacteroidota bacterium]|jgi:tRNA threonylcarbamoyladenosine biosynthesis protein TsaB
MALIVNIETATRNCSVAIARDGVVIAAREIAEQGYTHAEKLHVFIEEVMQEAAVSLSDLDAIAVSKGPGSYTGLRIGVSAAKGLCYALEKPLIAVDTLRVLAHAVSEVDGLIIPMIDARRMEVYAAIFDASKNEIREVQAEILTPDSYATSLGPIYIVGDSSEKAQTVLTDARFHFLEEIQFPSATIMAELSETQFKANQFVDVAYFEPFYLKDFMLSK